MDAIDVPAEVCFVACHPAAGAHFADFYYELTKQGRVRCRMVATEKAAEELARRKVPVHDFFYGKQSKTLKDLPEDEQEQLAASVAKICSTARWVITDLGQEFSAKVQDKLAERYPHIVRIAYYDNPEPFVPGGYSTTAAKVIQKAQAVLFANAKLAGVPLYSTPDQPIDLSGKQLIGLGYGNFQEIQDLREKRVSAHLSLKKSLLQPNTSSLAVYFGGANDVYYGQAFPRFLEILSESAQAEDLSSLTILVQQHPRSILEGNRDGMLLHEWKKTASPKAPKVAISSSPFNDALTAADLALYYQTGAAAKFMLVGVPTAQIGHEPFKDLLVRNGFCPAINESNQFLDLFKNFPTSPTEETHNKILNESGIDPSWADNLADVLQFVPVPAS